MRYIETKAVLDKNELIPLWDKRITHRNTEMYGEIICYEDDYLDRSLKVVDCLFDVKKKCLVKGIELNFYPDKLEFREGQEILHEISHRHLRKAVIKEIVYEDYELKVYQGKNIDKWLITNFKNQGINIEPKKIYAIKFWKAYYLLDNGVTIEWNHELFHIAHKPN